MHFTTRKDAEDTHQCTVGGRVKQSPEVSRVSLGEHQGEKWGSKDYYFFLCNCHRGVRGLGIRCRIYSGVRPYW